MLDLVWREREILSSTFLVGTRRTGSARTVVDAVRRTNIIESPEQRILMILACEGVSTLIWMVD